MKQLRPALIGLLVAASVALAVRAVDDTNNQTALGGNKTWTGNHTFNGTTTLSGDATFGSVTNANFKGVPWHDVKAYGAVGDGVTDDTAAIQAAINAAAGDRRRVVFFPAASYKVSQLVLTGKPVTLKGQGERGTFIKGDGTAHVIYAVNASFVTGIVIEDINIGFTTPQTTYDGVHFEFVELCAIHRAGFGNARYGVNFNFNARLCTISDSIFGSDNERGVNLHNGANQNRLVGNWFDENDSMGLYVNGADNVIVGNNFQDNTSRHLYVDANGNDNVIVGNSFIAGAGVYLTGIAIRIFGDRNLVSDNALDDHTNEIIVDAGADGNRMIGNDFSGTLSNTDSGTNTAWVHAGSAGLLFGPNGDINLYRSAANLLKTDDDFQITSAGATFVRRDGSTVGLAARNEATAATTNTTGFGFHLKDDGGTVEGFGQFHCTSTGITAGSEASSCTVRTRKAGALTDALVLNNLGQQTWEAVTFANLGTPSNGTFAYCSDCTKATPCASGGSGAFAKRINGAWDCD